MEQRKNTESSTTPPPMSWRPSAWVRPLLPPGRRCRVAAAAFDPVSVSYRCDGRKPERSREFIERLAGTISREEAAERLGIAGDERLYPPRRRAGEVRRTKRGRLCREHVPSVTFV